MKITEPNKIVSRLYKQFTALRTVSDATNYDYEKEAELKKQLADITNVVGAIEVMSKNSLIKLCAMQSSWRFMALHSFLIQFSKAADDMSL